MVVDIPLAVTVASDIGSPVEESVTIPEMVPFSRSVSSKSREVDSPGSTVMVSEEV